MTDLVYQGRSTAIRASSPAVRGEPVTPCKELPEKPVLTIIGSGFADFIPDLNVWIPAKVASEKYGIPSQTLYQWARRGKIRATQGDYGNRENVWYVDISQVKKIAKESDTYGR